MIVHTQKHVEPDALSKMSRALEATRYTRADGVSVLVTPSAMKEVPEAWRALVQESFPMNSDLQLGSRAYMKQLRRIPFGPVEIGGESNNTVFVAGPCSIESEEQIETVCHALVSLGVKVLRAGCFKPRTSPYSFQGMGIEGLKLLRSAADAHGLSVITEVRDASHVEDVITYTDIVQIGAKAMYDHGILNAAGGCGKPVMIKRGFGSTLKEFVQAAEFVLSKGNENVVLCERGIRTFETQTRFTLDLCGVEFIKQHTNLPIIVDPSHAMGYRYGVAGLSRAAMAQGVDGLIIECHPNPEQAKSDASQQIDLKSIQELYAQMVALAAAVGRNLV